MATTHRYRPARTDPDYYDDINLGSDSEIGVNSQSEIVVDPAGGVIVYKDSPEMSAGTEGSNGVEKTSVGMPDRLRGGGGDGEGKSRLEQEISALFSDEDDEFNMGASDVRMRATASEEDTSESDDNFTVEQAIEQIGFGRFQLKMSAIICVIHMTDAGELMLLSMLSPELHCKWHLQKWQQALITTIVFCGYLVGSPLWGKFADKFGRRTALIIVGFWMFFFGLMSSFSPNYHWMLILRGITGFGIGGAAQNVVLYSEFLPARVRGFWLTLVSFSWILGVVWVVAVAYFVMPAYGWRWLLVVAAMPLLIFICSCYFLPESAYYHVACGNKEKALAILQQVAKANRKPMPMGELKCGGGSSERGKFKDLFCDTKTSITTSLLLFIWFTMAFVYYGVVLLTTELFAQGHSCAAGEFDESKVCYESCESLSKSDYANLMYTTLAEFPGTLLTLGIIDYVGRKKTMSIQYVFCGLSIFLLFICTTKKLLLTVFLFFARALISGAFQGIYVYTPEVYPTHVRGIGLGTCGSIARIGCIVTPFVAQVLLEYSPKGTIGLYGGICFAAALAISLLPIETKGRKMISQVKEARATLRNTFKTSA